MARASEREGSWRDAMERAEGGGAGIWVCMHFQGGLSVAREKKQHSSLTGKERGRATDEGVQIQFKWRKLTSEVLTLVRWQCLVWVGHRWNHLSGVWSAESERRGNKRGGGGGVWTLTAYGTYRHPDCAPLSSFLEVRTKEKRGDREKGPGSGCRDGAPDFAAAGRGCLDSKGWGKSGGAVDSRLGFPATAAGLSQNSLSVFEGPCIATFSGMHPEYVS